MYPILIKIGSFELETYFTLISVALVLGILYALRRASSLIKKSTLFFDLLIVLIISAYIGARLFHVLFELPKFYFSNPLEIFKVWKGGFVAYGSFIAALVCGIFFIQRKNLPGFEIADILSAPLMLIIGIGRISCFLAGCCYGKPTNHWIGVKFPELSQAPSNIFIHPTQLYMSFSAFLILLLIIFIEKKLKRYYFRGLSFSLVLIFYPISRFTVEFFRNDFRGGTFFNLSVSQLLSIFLVISGLCFFLISKKHHKSS